MDYVGEGKDAEDRQLRKIISPHIGILLVRRGTSSVSFLPIAWSGASELDEVSKTTSSLKDRLHRISVAKLAFGKDVIHKSGWLPNSPFWHRITATLLETRHALCCPIRVGSAAFITGAAYGHEVHRIGHPNRRKETVNAH